MTQLSISLLGPFRATLDGEPVASFRLIRARALLAYLAVESARPHSRSALAGLLWPDWPETSARTSLRSALADLRRAVGDRDAQPPFLLIARETVQLNPKGDVDLDVSTLELAAVLVERGRPLDDAAVDSLTRALDSYRGDLLEGLAFADSYAFDAWATQQREHFRRLAAVVGRRLTAHALAEGRWQDAEGFSRRCIALDPWDENAHLCLMRALSGRGERNAALAHYDALREELERSLQVAPQAETTRLYDSIRREQIDLATGVQTQRSAASRPPHGLTALDFTAEIARHMRQFVGRGWLLTQMDDWLDGDEGQLLLLSGDPGSGKSAFMAKLADSHPSVAAVHFCVAGLEDSLDPVVFARSIAAQLAERLPGYRQAIADGDLGPSDASPGTLLRRLVIDPLYGIGQQEPILVLVDALDEALVRGQSNIARVLCDRVYDLPPWVRLVLSTRREPVILDMFASAKIVEIECLSEENISDVHALLSRDLPELRAFGAVEAEQVSALIAERGEGNFLYVSRVLAGIRSGRCDPRRPETFPMGLVDGYRQELQRAYPDAKGFDAVRPLLEIVCASREPFAADRIAEIAGGRTLDVEIRLERVAPLFPLRSAGFQPFHKSIADWMTGEVGRAGEFRIDERRGHDRIADTLLAEWHSEQVSSYLLAQLPTHLIAAQSWDDLEGILTDLRFVELKCSAGMTYALVSDYDAALAALPEAQEETRERVLHQERLARYASELAAHARGEREIPAPPPSVTPTTEDVRSPIASPTSRLVNIRSFHQFVSFEAPWLSKWSNRPGFVWQQAHNWSKQGPVSAAAEQTRQRHARVPLLLREADQRPTPGPSSVLSATLSCRGQEMVHARITADGRRAVSVGADRTLRIFDVESGECLRVLRDEADRPSPVFEGNSVDLWSVAITPDGRLALCVGRDGPLRVWDLERGVRVKEIVPDPLSLPMPALRLQVECGSAACISADGGIALISRGLTGTRSHLEIGMGPASRADYARAEVWDLERGTLERTLASQGPVFAVAMTADGSCAVTGGAQGELRVWDTATGECLHFLKGHLDSVLAVSVTPDGTRAISGGGKWRSDQPGDGAVRVWDLETGQCLRVLGVSRALAGNLAISDDGTTGYVFCNALLSLGAVVQTWDLESAQLQRSLPRSSTKGPTLSVTPDGFVAVTGGFGGMLALWDLRRGDIDHSPREYLSPSVAIGVSPDGQSAAYSGAEASVRVWGLQTGQVETELVGHRSFARDVMYSPDGRRILTAGADGRLGIWDSASGQSVCLAEAHRAQMTGVSALPDGSRAVTGSADSVLEMWDLRDGSDLGPIGKYPSWLSGVAVTPDGRLAVTDGADSTVRLWDLRRRACLWASERSVAGVGKVAITPVGKLALIGGRDSALRIWDIRTGGCIASLDDQSLWVSWIGVSAGGRFAMYPDGERVLRLWDLQTRRCIAIAHTGTYDSAFEALAGGHLAAATSQGTVGLLHCTNLPEETPIVTAVRLWLHARDRFGGEWDEDITGRCRWCGALFPVSAGILGVIGGITRDEALPEDASPCLELPEEAWETPGLLSECPKCGKPLQFNPFLVDEREWLGG